jgi:hypothetical protein
LRPLQWLEENPPAQGRARQIFLLTDGEISNVDQVLDLCRSMATSTRIFSFGLGQSPSRSLVKGLARATNGRFVFIPPNTSVDVHVGEQLQKALQPCITNVQVKWNLGTTAMTSVPTKIPPVYVNDRLIVYALVDDKTNQFEHNSSVELKTEQHQLSVAKIVRVPSMSSNETIARLAAKALILELQHSKLPPSTKKSSAGSLQTRFQEPTASNDESATTKEATKKHIVDLSLKYNILSPHTAFIGVEKRLNASNADMVFREVPIQISADDQHLARAPVKMMMKCMAMPRMMPSMAKSFSNSSSQLRNSEVAGAYLMVDSSADYAYSDVNDILMDADEVGAVMSPIQKVKEEVWPTDNQDIVRYLINKQKFDGSWNLDSKSVQQLTGKPLSDFQLSTNSQVLVSAIVIAVLETRFASFSSMWHGVVQKARKRIIDLLGKDIKKLDSLLEDIRKQL